MMRAGKQTKADLMVKLAPDAKSFMIYVLKRADDGAIVGARVKEFYQPSKPDQLQRLVQGWENWRKATEEELETARRIVTTKARQAGGAR